MCQERKLAHSGAITARFTFRRSGLLRPRLPRHIAPGARINLNRFWADLEEFYVTRTSSSLLLLPHTMEEEEENCHNENLERERKMAKQQQQEGVPSGRSS
jgi:hypothetical protein